MVQIINETVGYVPTRGVLQAGGYETRACNNSKLVPEALEMMVDEAVGLLSELFREGAQ